MMIEVTEEAAAKLKELLEKQGRASHGLRLEVEQAGCSCGSDCGCGGGISYRLYPEEQPQPEDVVLEQGGVRIFISQAPDWITPYTQSMDKGLSPLARTDGDLRNKRRASAPVSATEPFLSGSIAAFTT
jgi:Fe-S cluster assembly iron-binding protein IscA